MDGYFCSPTQQQVIIVDNQGVEIGHAQVNDSIPMIKSKNIPIAH
jgi:hypothetical protein